MKLKELLIPWVDVKCLDVEVLGLQNDSREIHKGYLFFAYPGAVSDGRRYIPEALTNGACAIIYEPDNWPMDCPLPDPGLSVAFPRLVEHLALIASRFYGQPTKKMSVTGVTGTNGKTTVAYQLAQAHELLSHHSAYIGTLGQGKVSSLQSLVNTTPDALQLQHLFYAYHQQDITQVCMEVSSHALSQQRVDCIDFEQAIFTNLTLDHLDYHHTMEAYANAKASLFSRASLKWAIVNHDDRYTPIMTRAMNPSCRLITYGIKEGSEVRALSWSTTLEGTLIDIDSPWGKQHLAIRALGFFNIYNALAVFTSLMVCGFQVAKVTAVMAKLLPAPGRMEVVVQEPCVIVDYAHTPDALENVLLTLNKVKKNRLLVVFGCGGDRDKTKRPIMGEIAARLSDVAIVTSDNPRTEDPEQILREIEKGMEENSTIVHSIVDRKTAIIKALNMANPDDIILIAGKGHEAYQQIGLMCHNFSDQTVIKQYFGNKIVDFIEKTLRD